TIGAAGLIGYRLSAGGGAAAVSDTSLAVLPFTNEVGSDELDYLANGMSTAIRDGLSRNAAMTVVARSSSEAVVEEGLSTEQIAERLNVASLLEGRVQRGLDGSVQLVTTLVDARRGVARRVIEQVYRSDAAIEMRDAIVRMVSAELSVQEATGEAGRASVPEAFDEYMKGRDVLRDTGSLESIEQARRHFESAMALDPAYSEPVMFNAEIHMILGVYEADAETARALKDRALLLARKAVELAPNDPQTHVVLGYVISILELDYAAAAEPFERAKAIGLNSADGLQRYALYLLSIGQIDTMLDVTKRAQSLDPLNMGIREIVGMGYAAMGHYDKAVAAFERVLARNPDRYLTRARLGSALIFGGQVEAGLAQCALELNEMDRLPCQAFAAVRQGDRDGAETALRTLIDTFGDPSAYQQAQVLAQLGRGEDAIATLRKAETLRDTGLSQLLVDPALAPIRDDPEYKAMLVRFGLAG
ncbi:MAG: tetratricopeptide repeat protein, partial [Litorimonas sp.]